jgi:tRNA (cmo5U34)-methyltransferase
MNDNATAHMAGEYDNKIEQTIPCYKFFHEQALDLVRVYNDKPKNWLDTGCGTGTMAGKILSSFPDIRLVLADPSPDMIEIARNKLERYQEQIRIITTSSQELEEAEHSFDVITAIMCHHYLDPDTRATATGNCYRMLKQGSIYITFENIRPTSEIGIKRGLQRWKDFQIKSGKSEEEATAHIDRFGKEYFPVTIEEHLQLLRKTGFTCTEVLWVSYMQAGFYAIK